jgi:cytochrome c oxidase cbb3-type subunit 3
MKPRAPRDQVLGHADEADGIEEYDNALPDWWLGLFWFTIIWAAAYALHYHVIADRSQEKHLAAELAAAEARWPAAAASDEFAVTAQLATAGQAVYQSNCVACHGPALEGGIGPNLKDEAWIHGGEPRQVLHTVMEGVAARGMPGWGAILGPEKARQVAAYVLSQSQP